MNGESNSSFRFNIVAKIAGIKDIHQYQLFDKKNQHIIDAAKNFLKKEIFFEYDSNLDNSILNEISHQLQISCFKSSFSFYKKKDDYEAMRILHCVKNGEYIQNTSFRIENNYSLDSNTVIDDNLSINSHNIAYKIKYTISEKQISLPNFSIDPNANEDEEIIKQSRSGLDLRLKKLFKN